MISRYADGTYLSEEFKQVIAGDGRTFKVQILLEGQPLDGDIAEAKIYRGACGEQPFPGALFVPHMSCEIRETSASLEGKEIEVRIGVLMDREQDIWQWIKQGRYIVSKPEISADIVNFEAIGTLGTEGSEEISLAADYYANLIQKIEAKTGITINVVGLTIPRTKSRAFDGTVRDAAAMVAHGLGGFLTEDVDGNWVIAAYGGGELVDISADRMQEPPQYGENTYELGGVEVESAVVDMTMGNPLLDPWDYVVVEGADLSHFIIDAQGHLILLNSQTVTGEMRMDILQNGRLQYTHDDTADIDFAVDNGHLYMMRTINNAVPCLQITHTFNGGCSTEINAEAETWVQEKSKIMGPAQKNMQHFWTDADGAHVTQETKESFLSDPSGGNTLNDSTGLDVRDGLVSLAKFGASGTRIGQESGKNVLIDSSGLDVRNGTASTAKFGASSARIGEIGKGYTYITRAGLGVYEGAQNRSQAWLGLYNYGDEYNPDEHFFARFGKADSVSDEGNVKIQTNKLKQSDEGPSPRISISDGSKTIASIFKTYSVDYDPDTNYDTAGEMILGGAAGAARGMTIIGESRTLKSDKTKRQGIGQIAVHGSSGANSQFSLLIGTKEALFASPDQVIMGYGANVECSGNSLGLNGNVYINEHESPVGDVVSDSKTSGLKSIAKNGDTFTTTGAKFTLQQGSWDISVSVRFPAKSGGLRKICLSVNGTLHYVSRATCGANSDHNVDVQTSLPLKISSDEAEIEVMGWQNSDSALTPSSVYWKAIRIA